jgi:hypothetical protein
MALFCTHFRTLLAVYVLHRLGCAHNRGVHWSWSLSAARLDGRPGRRRAGLLELTMTAARSLRLAAVLLGLSVTAGCFPYFGRGGQKPVATDPTRFVDGETRQTIPVVLVIPRYVSGTGVFAHGVGEGRDFLLMHPFLHRADRPFAPVQPRCALLVLGYAWAEVGHCSILDGALVVAPGYRARWVSYWLWNRGGEEGHGFPDEASLSPITSEQARAQAVDLSSALALASFPTDSLLWNCAGCTYHVRFSTSEGQLVQSFLRSQGSP